MQGEEAGDLLIPLRPWCRAALEYLCFLACLQCMWARKAPLLEKYPNVSRVKSLPHVLECQGDVVRAAT